MDPIQSYRWRLCVVLVLSWYYLTRIRPRLLGKRKGPRRYSIKAKETRQFAYLSRLSLENDVNCKNLLRMERKQFHEFCDMLATSGGLKSSKYVTLEEKAASFLMIIGHHFKNRVNMFAFERSGHTISTYFHEVLKCILQLHPILLAKPEPITAECQEEPLKHFKGCLGALDGTYIDATMSKSRQCWYRSRKGTIAVNVLGVCDFNMRFIYVLTGWEGSAADGKVLRDAITRDEGAFQVPEGNYYLVDGGYGHCPGFMAPYRSTRYHLSEWERGDRRPQTKEEFFNLKHASARNVIERTWGLLKKRFGILRSPSFYSIDTQNNIILACCLVHNFLRDKAPDDTLDEEDSSDDEDEQPARRRSRQEAPAPPMFIDELNLDEPTWVALRDVMATIMFNRWREYLVRRGRR